MTAVACFAALDTATKLIAATVSVVMVMWFRYVFQTIVTVASLLPVRGRALLHTRRPLLQFVRGVLLLLTSSLAFFSLRHLPVAEFTALVMLTPLLITLIAAVTLGERVSLLRWALVLGGFAGALTVIRPGGASFTWTLLLPLTLVVASAGFQLLTSELAKSDDAATTHVYTGFVGAALTTLALPFAWQPLGSWTLWAIVLLVCLFSTVGHFLLIRAYAHAPASVVTPYLYFQIAFATLAGWLVFAHAPDGWSIAGMAVIAACGAGGTWLADRERREVA